MAPSIGAEGIYAYYHYAGKVYQHLLCPAVNSFHGARLYVPVDTGVLAEFTVVQGMGATGGSNNWYTCIRSG
jgi:hypothetical protein